jgi:hypothetical protein
LLADAEVEIEVADMERQAEAAEVVDYQGHHEDQEDGYEEPEQPDEEGWYGAPQCAHEAFNFPASQETC